MPVRRQHRLQALIDTIPQDGNFLSVSELCERLARFREPGGERRTFPTQILRDIRHLETLYPALIIQGGVGAALKVKWSPNGRPLARYVLDTAQVIAFATLQKFGVSVMPRHMSDVLAPFMRAAEVEAAAKLADDNPDFTPLRAKSAATAWLSKIVYLPERITFIAPTVDPAVEKTVHGALMEDKPLSILYKESKVRRTVSPLGIAQQGARTYLIAQPHTEDAKPRTYLLARIRSAKEVDEAFRKPARFSLNKYLLKNIAPPRGDYFSHDEYGAPIRLKLWVSANSQFLKETPLSEDQTTEPCDLAEPEGAYLLSCTVPLSENLVWWLLSVAQSVRVLEPAKLRERVVSDLKASLVGYGAL